MFIRHEACCTPLPVLPLPSKAWRSHCLGPGLRQVPPGLDQRWKPIRVLPTHHKTTQIQFISSNMQKTEVLSRTEGNKHDKDYVPMCLTSGWRKGPNSSAHSPSRWEGPPDPLQSAPFYMSLEFSDFALMFTTGSGSCVPAQGGDTGTPWSRAQRAGGLWGNTPPELQNTLLAQEQKVPRLLPSTRHDMTSHCHWFGSHHRKPFWWLPRCCWHLQAQILPETTRSCCCQRCPWQRCWGLLAPRCCCGNGTGYPFISFSKQLTYWYGQDISFLPYDLSCRRK